MRRSWQFLPAAKLRLLAGEVEQIAAVTDAVRHLDQRPAPIVEHVAALHHFRKKSGELASFPLDFSRRGVIRKPRSRSFPFFHHTRVGTRADDAYLPDSRAHLRPGYRPRKKCPAD